MNLPHILEALRKYNNLKQSTLNLGSEIITSYERQQLKQCISFLENEIKQDNCKCDMPIYTVDEIFHCSRCNKLLPNIITKEI